MRAVKAVVGSVLVLVGLAAAAVFAVAAAVRVLDRTNGAIASSGAERTYLLHVPSTYDGATPTPLVISLHGAAMWPAQQRRMSGWDRLADEEGFLVVFPSGSSVPKIWHVDSGEGLATDVRFIADLIDTLQAAYNVDPKRIYVDGMSNGGGMAFVLSCALSDRIAAVGMVAAAQSLPWTWCTDDRPVPMIAFHGTADPIVPYLGGRSAVTPAPFPSVETWTASWARRNRCAAGPVRAAVAPDVARLEYTSCAGDAAVVLYRLEGGGHTWPGGEPLPRWMLGPTHRELDATRLIWEFFHEHPLVVTHA